MGSRISIIRNRSARAVDERFTRPQRLIRQPSNVDYKKLRKLILSQKLAPCFEGVEDSNPDLEECPICFFFYPSLNRSRCCMKGICTECFLQMKPSNVTDRPTQCPFCKYSSYAVEYRGAKTEEEKSLEQAEEQKVLEAKIRMQSQDGNRVTLADRISSEVEARSPVLLFRPLSSIIGDAQDFRDSEIPLAEERTRTSQTPFPNNSNESRPEEFDLDLEEIMMTQAILRSIQDADQSCGMSGTIESRGSGHESNQCGPSSALVGQGEPSSESATAELAVAIARMAERNIRWPETLELIQENTDQANHPIEEAGHTGHLMGPEFDEVQSEDECLESCSLTTEDDSWGLLAARILEEKQSSESGFVSEEDLVADVADNRSCSSSSSVCSLSDGSAESSNCSDNAAVGSCSNLSASFMVHQPFVVAADTATCLTTMVASATL